MEKMNWNYIAGFFDGEGSISVSRVKGNNPPERIQYCLRIRIYNSEISVLKKIKSFLNYGKIYINHRLIGHNLVYELSIIKKLEVKEFLDKIKDLVMLKKSQIDFVLNNYDFQFRKSNKYFDIDKFRGFINRKNMDKLRKNHTIKLGEK